MRLTVDCHHCPDKRYLLDGPPAWVARWITDHWYCIHAEKERNRAMCRSISEGGRRCGGPHRTLTEDEERYLARVDQLEASPDPVGLMADEAHQRNTDAVQSAAHRLTLEALED